MTTVPRTAPRFKPHFSQSNGETPIYAWDRPDRGAQLDLFAGEVAR